MFMLWLGIPTSSSTDSDRQIAYHDPYGLDIDALQKQYAKDHLIVDSD